MQEELLNVLKRNHIDASLLREFIFKGLWKPSVREIDVVIQDMKFKITVLENIKEKLESKLNEGSIK